jgi:hypothetical protein
MLDVETTSQAEEREATRPPSRFWSSLFKLAILVGGGAFAARYYMNREDQRPAPPRHETGGSAIVTPPPTTGSSADKVTPATIDAAAIAEGSATTGSDLGSGSATTGSDLGSAIAGSDLGSAIAAVGSAEGSGSGSGTGTGSGSAEEIEMDPKTANDLDPEATTGSAASATEEAADAPKTKEEVETHAPPPPPAAVPQIATNLHDAVALIKDGKRELALTSLRALAAKNPHSAYIPFLLGNLYFDQRWWSVAMDHYADAIKKNAEYRQNPTINRNVIKMLSSPKTQQRATNFLRGTIGHPAAIYLRFAAGHEANPVVRKQAAMLTRYIR